MPYNLKHVTFPVLNIEFCVLLVQFKIELILNLKLCYSGLVTKNWIILCTVKCQYWWSSTPDRPVSKWQVIASDLRQKRSCNLIVHIVILCYFSPFPLLQSKVHVFLQLFLTCIWNIDIHQRSVMALKASEDARVKKKACNTDI